MHRIGFHISVAQGFLKVFDDAKTLGANCCQIFTHSPRSWAFNVVSEDIGKLFKIAYEKTILNLIVVHDSYLLNLASKDCTIRDKSIDSIKKNLFHAIEWA